MLPPLPTFTLPSTVSDVPEPATATVPVDPAWTATSRSPPTVAVLPPLGLLAVTLKVPFEPFCTPTLNVSEYTGAAVEEVYRAGAGVAKVIGATDRES